MDLAAVAARFLPPALRGGLSIPPFASTEAIMRSPRLLRFLLPALLVAVPACGPGDGGPGAVTGDPEYGGTAIVGVTSDFQAFNPVTNTAILTDEVMKHMLFTPLVQYDENLEIQPHLAESWDLDERGVTFRLRQDVRWHDGQPVTAEDVKFTFDLAKDEATASLLGSAYLTMVQSATVVDPYTIRFEFTTPHSQPLDAFWWPPLPRHLLQDVSPAALTQAPFNANPVGSGPFRWGSWDRGQRLTLEANTEYSEALGGRPFLDRVVFRVIPEATTMMTELLAGSVDMIGWTLQADQAQQLMGQGGIDVRHFPSREFTYIGLNNQRPQFQDAATRRALAMAIDRPQIVGALLHDFASLSAGPIPDWSPLDPGVESLSFDANAARQLLQQAGWQQGGDGVMQRQGQPLRFALLVNAANRVHQDIATVVQQQLRQIGASVEIRTVEFQTMLREHRAREYDAVLSNWTLDTFKVDPTPLFSCEQAQTPQSANRAGFCNPQLDQMMMQGLRTTDQGQAQRIWTDFARLLQQEQPIVFLHWSDDLGAIGPRLQNVQTDIRSKLVNAREWWMPADRQR
jgi:peptide/nickel transport system substrate-binding protein